MRKRLAQDVARSLPPPRPGVVQLTGLFGLSDFVQKAAPELVANAMLCAVNQAAYLLKRQLEGQGEEFLKRGGFTEKLYGARKRTRLSDVSDRSDKPPECPNCGKPMVLRTARNGPRPGRKFWGCTAYPACKATVFITKPPAP